MNTNKKDIKGTNASEQDFSQADKATQKSQDRASAQSRSSYSQEQEDDDMESEQSVSSSRSSLELDEDEDEISSPVAGRQQGSAQKPVQGQDRGAQKQVPGTSTSANTGANKGVQTGNSKDLNRK